jgi:hypothetical protein
MGWADRRRQARPTHKHRQVTVAVNMEAVNMVAAKSTR